MHAIKLMHVAKRDLGLDDDDYRAVLERVTGKRSAADMDDDQRAACVKEFRRLGFGAAKSPHRGRLSGPYAGKLQALWLSAWHLGMVRDRRDSALTAFVERQTGIASTRWLRNAYDAQAAIEGLKAWIARPVAQGGGGVVWPVKGGAIAQKYAVAAAQCTILRVEPPAMHGWDGMAMDAFIAAYGARIRGAQARP